MDSIFANVASNCIGGPKLGRFIDCSWDIELVINRRNWKYELDLIDHSKAFLSADLEVSHDSFVDKKQLSSKYHFLEKEGRLASSCFMLP